LSFSVDIVEVDQLDHCLFSFIAGPWAEFDDPGLTTGTTRNLFSNIAEEFLHSFFFLQVSQYHTTLMRGVILSLRDQWLHIHAKRLCLCKCSYNTLVLDELASQITQQGFAMCLSAA